MTERMSNEEYRALKQQEKEDVFEMLSDATQSLLSADKLREYADMQAKLFGHSASNVLLIMEQKPEATWVRTFDDWKSDNVSLKKGEKGILTLVADYYQKPDGTMGMTSKVEKLFDISQTAAADRNVTRPVYRSAAELLMECSPQTIEKQELPNEAYALYDSQTNEIHVKQGLDPDTKFFVIAREQAVAMLTRDEVLGRDNVIPQAEFSAYLVTKRYGLNAPDIDFGRMSESFHGMEEKKVREELGGMRFTADRIHHKVQEQVELSRGHREAER